MSFDSKIEEVISIISKLSYQNPGKPLIVGLSASYGGGKTAGAGKTTLALAINQKMEKSITILHTDAFLLPLPGNRNKKAFHSQLLRMSLNNLIEGKPTRTPLLDEQNKCGLGVAFRKHSVPSSDQAGKMQESLNSINEFLQSDNLFETDKMPIEITNEKDIRLVNPSDVIIVEGSGLAAIASNLDCIIIGLPDTKKAEKNYINRWMEHRISNFIDEHNKYPNAQEINLIEITGWLSLKHQPKTCSIESILVPEFYLKFIDNFSLEDLVSNGKIILVKDYISDDNEIHEMLISNKYSNIIDEQFSNAHKIVCKIFDKARDSEGKPLFRGGSNNIYITGGMNRDIVSQSGRKPQDFDLICITDKNFENQFIEFVAWLKNNQNRFGINSIKIRTMRKSKAIHLEIDGDDYELNMCHVKTESEMVQYLIANHQFTIDGFYRKLSEFGSKVLITDASGQGQKDIENRIIRFSPGRAESNDPATESINTIRAAMMPLKMANLAQIDTDSGEINNLFSFDIAVQQQIEKIIKENFPNLPKWKIAHTLDRELPNELNLIQNQKIRLFFENQIQSDPFWIRLKNLLN